MLRKGLTALSLLGLTIALLTFPCAAADLTPFAGFANPNANLRTSPHFGAAFDLHLSKHASMEQRFNLFPQFPQLSTGPEARTWGLGYNTSFSYSLPASEKVVPYALAGIGFISALRDPLNIGTNFDFVYGGGLKIFEAGKRMGLRLEVRGHRVPNLIGSRDYNVFEFTVGPIFRLRAE